MRRTLSILAIGATLAILVVALLSVVGLRSTSAGDGHALSPSDVPAKFNLGSGQWSDPATWNDRNVPGPGDSVTIKQGSRVVYDVLSQAEIYQLTVAGSLVFSREVSTNLDVGDVFVPQGGYLEIGTESQPMQAGVKSSIRFVNSADGEHALHILGEAQIHGNPLAYVYTTLADDGLKGSTALRVQDQVHWNPEDHIVITSTTQDARQSEENTIIGVEGRAIYLKTPLKFHHDGRSPAQAQVALLTRNVVITSKNPMLRGHTLFMAGAKGSISYAEFSHLGAKGQVAKYPIHFHMAGDTMRGSYVKGASIWDSGNRFITVHSTQYVSLSYNVGYNAVGHGFFLEAGDEVFVDLDHNLGILVTPGDILLSDRSPAVFWIQSPVNSLTNNIAVSSVGGSGFELAIPDGARDIPALGGSVVPRKLPLLRFEGNEAHSNGRFGVRVYRFNTSELDVSKLFGLKVWRNRQAGLFLEGNWMMVSESSVFGNGKVNVSLAGNGNTLEIGKVMGELESVRGRHLAAYPATPRGILLRGMNSTISRSWLEGHESGAGVTGSDISLTPASPGEKDDPITVLITDSVMKSPRPIIFGYPPHERSAVEVRTYQGKLKDDFLLYRFDVDPPAPCAGATLEMSFAAMKCLIQ